MAKVIGIDGYTTRLGMCHVGHCLISEFYIFTRCVRCCIQSLHAMLVLVDMVGGMQGHISKSACRHHSAGPDLPLD